MSQPENTEQQEQNRATDAYERLRDVIVRGKLAPGARIIESEVANRLGVSRTPVRSALQRLENEGYVVTPDGNRQSRSTVAPVTSEDAWELFNIVGEIEGLAARWAAALPGDTRQQLVDDLRRINGEFLEASKSETPDPNRIFTLDSRFHRRYVEAAGGPRLIGLHDAIKPQAERYIRFHIRALSNWIGETSAQEHDAAVKAIALGDRDISQKRIQINWRNAAKRLGEQIDVAGEVGSW